MFSSFLGVSIWVVDAQPKTVWGYQGKNVKSNRFFTHIQEECLNFHTILSDKHSVLFILLCKPSPSSPYNVLHQLTKNSQVEFSIHWLTWSRWVSCKTLDLWTPSLWEPEVCSECACRRGARNLCRWICHGTRPRGENSHCHLNFTFKTRKWEWRP